MFLKMYAYSKSCGNVHSAYKWYKEGTSWYLCGIQCDEEYWSFCNVEILENFATDSLALTLLSKIHLANLRINKIHIFRGKIGSTFSQMLREAFKSNFWKNLGFRPN